jgi:transcriptional regulator with GAF, ATPase, and Fis domain
MLENINSDDLEFTVESDRLLALLALFNEGFCVEWVISLTKKKVPEIKRLLNNWVRQGLLVKEGGFFLFANGGRKKEILDSLDADERNELRHKILNFLLKESPPDDDMVLVLSHQLLDIPNNFEECGWLVRAGDINLKRHRHEEARTCYKKVLLELSSRNGELSDCLYTEAALKYVKISTASDQTHSVSTLIEQALVRAKRSNDEHNYALLLMQLAKNEWLCSRYDKAIKYFQEGWVIAEKSKNPIILRSAKFFSTFFLYWQGRFEEAVKAYESFMPDLDRYAEERFPILGSLCIGRCYALIGQISQGIGMLDAIHKHCLETGNGTMAAHAAYTIGTTLLEIFQTDEAVKYLEEALHIASQENVGWVLIRGKLIMALALYLQGKSQQCLDLLTEYLERINRFQVTVRPYPYLLPLLWGLEESKISPLPCFSLTDEIQQMIHSGNVFIKGVANRYQGMLERREGASSKKILHSLNRSLRWLKLSGNQIEVAKTHLEFTYQYLSLQDTENAKKHAKTAYDILLSINENLYPDDLKHLVQERSLKVNPYRGAIEMGLEVLKINDDTNVPQRIISIVNQAIGAERGAIFSFEGEGSSRRLVLRASKNLTSDEVAHAKFQCSMKLIDKVVNTSKGVLFSAKRANDFGDASIDNVASCICAPMILRNELVGVLYHDNRVFPNIFENCHLEFLNKFASLAAFALENVALNVKLRKLNSKRPDDLCYEAEDIQPDEIVGQSPPMLRVIRQAVQVAKTDATVLLLGETGVGKDLLARYIHRHSPRHDKPFVVVQCDSIPETLLHSELFGYEKGAFTGAAQKRIGKFELANEGTVFLDEIASSPLQFQSTLLRVLQSREFERLGGNETRYSNFRLVVATNCDLQKEVKEGRFRSDLYYRLNVFPIHIPPLRERKKDIPLIADFIAKAYSVKLRKNFEGILPSEMDKLLRYDWPGNVRELKNIIERSIILNQESTIQIPELSSHGSLFDYPGGNMSLEEIERRHISLTLEKAGWKLGGSGGAAELLNLHPSTLAFRMKKLGIERSKDVSRKRGKGHVSA